MMSRIEYFNEIIADYLSYCSFIAAIAIAL